MSSWCRGLGHCLLLFDRRTLMGPVEQGNDSCTWTSVARLDEGIRGAWGVGRSADVWAVADVMMRFRNETDGGLVS